MNRRESLRSIVLGSMAGTLALESCTGAPEQEVVDKIWKHQYGRTPKEQAIDEKLLAEQYFGSHEMQTITVLAQLILPPTNQGTIEQAEVPAFIEFMAKNFPSLQTQLRGGMMWLDNHCNCFSRPQGQGAKTRNSIFLLDAQFGGYRLFYLRSGHQRIGLSRQPTQCVGWCTR
ncbi:MAG: gluconate 2-dehydrogenase subunit 3 family protein [Flavobacteriaceae bacterium]